MLERLAGSRARAVVSIAEEEAKKLHDEEVEPIHILLGLVLDNNGAAAAALQSLGISHDFLLYRMKQLRGKTYNSDNDTVPPPPSVHSQQTKHILACASRSATNAGDRCVSTEHILIALLDSVMMSEGLARKILEEKFSLSAIRESVCEVQIGEYSSEEDGKT